MPATRVTWWRRWIASLPVVAALLIVAGHPTAEAVNPAPAGLAGVMFTAAVNPAQPAVGERPDVPVLSKRSGAWLPGLGGFAAESLAVYRLPAAGHGWLVGDTIIQNHSAVRDAANRGRAPPQTA